jgi:L-amino acid N-acyltransferase YncA
MPAASDLVNILIPVILVLAVVILFLRIARRVRKKGGSLTSVLVGSTFELHSQDRRKAMEVVVESHAGKKQEEPPSGDGDDGHLTEEKSAPAGDVLIEEMRPEDWPQVQAIHEEGIATGQASFERQVPGWEEWDRRHLPICRLVARCDGEMIGWAALRPASQKSFYHGVAEDSVYVKRTWWGRGVGGKLLRALVEQSEHSGIWTLQALIFPENAISIALHESERFRIVGLRERLGQMDGVWRDVMLLERRSWVVGVSSSPGRQI